MIWLALLLSLVLPVVPTVEVTPIRIPIPEHCSQVFHRYAVDQTTRVELVADLVMKLAHGRSTITLSNEGGSCRIGDGVEPSDVVVPSDVWRAALTIPLDRWEPLAHEIAHVFWTHNCATVALPDDVTVELCHAP